MSSIGSIIGVCAFGFAALGYSQKAERLVVDCTAEVSTLAQVQGYAPSAPICQKVKNEAAVAEVVVSTLTRPFGQGQK